MIEFTQKIICWYDNNKRVLPWRKTSDPYKIWISEIILQQTRVDQGTDYYIRFINLFPDIKTLAAAPENAVLKAWQGLGYYSRARNLHHAAKQIMHEFQGVFPSAYPDIKELKGIGPYTAAAIASIALNQAYPAIDGNVYRVLSRFFGVETPIDTTTGKKTIEELSNELIKKDDPGTYNQAVMEFGATCCTPKNPSCPTCIFSDGCIAFNTKKTDFIPVKQKSTTQRNRYLNYLYIENNGECFIRQRINKDIWKNMYEFPLIETITHTDPEQLMQSVSWKSIFNNKKITVEKISGIIVHQLSHQRLHTRFFKIKTSDDVYLPESMRIKKKDIYKFAVPRLIDRFIKNEMG